MKRLLPALSRFFRSRLFRNILFGFFIFEALWFVFSAIYPMAFDEDFHFGIIKIYSHYWLPFLQDQPAGGDPFGALARDPSYLYHYIMSFPYRLLTHITSNETAQIIILRVVNVGLFTVGIGLFYKLILRVLRSPALANISLAVFILIPIVPQLAAHINYDNLLMPLTAWTCLLTLDVIEQFRKRVINLKILLTLLNVCLLTSLVKYAYLPIFAAVVFFVALYGYLHLRRGHWPAILQAARKTLSKKMLFGFALLTVVSAGLFMQRYGVNVIKYHTPIADCGDVLDYDHCKSYSPWLRNYNYEAEKTTVDKNPIAYFYSWEQGLRYRLFFAVNSSSRNFENYPPLPVPYQSALAFGAFGLVVILMYIRRILKDPFMAFAGLASGLYVLALFVEDYSQFIETAQPVAINGRYLLPVLFLAALLIGRAMQIVLATYHKTWLKPILAALALLLFLQGGGVMTFILRSDAHWDWPNTAVVHVNNAARHVLAPLIWEGSKQKQGP